MIVVIIKKYYDNQEKYEEKKLGQIPAKITVQFTVQGLIETPNNKRCSWKNQYIYRSKCIFKN